MGKTKNFAALVVLVVLVMVGFIAGTAEGALAAGEGAKVSPVIDRILAKKELVVGTAASMPPLNMTTKDGKVIGLEADLAGMFATGMNVKLTLKPMRFDDLLPALQAGRIDMILSGMTMSPGRNLTVAFAGPYFDSGKSILTKRANAEAMNTLAKINDPDKVLVALRGSTSEQFVRKVIPNAKLLLSEDYDSGVAMLRNGQAQAMVADFPICLVSVFRFPTDGLATLDKPLSYEPIGVALPPNDPLLVNWVQNTLKSLEKTGDMEMLMQKWFKDSTWMSQLP